EIGERLAIALKNAVVRAGFVHEHEGYGPNEACREHDGASHLAGRNRDLVTTVVAASDAIELGLDLPRASARAAAARDGLLLAIRRHDREIGFQVAKPRVVLNAREQRHHRLRIWRERVREVVAGRRDEAADRLGAELDQGGGSLQDPVNL